MIALYQEKTAWGNEICDSLLFPPLHSGDTRIPPIFSTAIGNCIACLSQQGGNATKFLEEFTLCINTLKTAKDVVRNYSKLRVPRADLWWYCGGKILQSIIPSNCRGTCTLIPLTMPFTLAFRKGSPQIQERSKRSVGVSFDDRICIDTIGAPRGVPDEHKSRNQLAAGFESSLFWWVTINKNGDWINYIYYNQQRFINYIRDAIKGIAE